MAYSAISDLLLGDLQIGNSINRQAYIDQAAKDMDSKMGFFYELPLTPQRPPGIAYVDPQNDGNRTTDWLVLPLNEQYLLFGINNKLATGRLILTLDLSGEGGVQHAYGLALLKEAQMELMMIANGDVFLSAQRLATTTIATEDDRIPSCHNDDEESLLLGFENSIMRGVPWHTTPGNVRKPAFNQWIPPWW